MTAQSLPGFGVIIFPKSRPFQQGKTTRGKLICKVMVAVTTQSLINQPVEAGPYIPAPVILRRKLRGIGWRVGDGKRGPEVLLLKLADQLFGLIRRWQAAKEGHELAGVGLKDRLFPRSCQIVRKTIDDHSGSEPVAYCLRAVEPSGRFRWATESYSDFSHCLHIGG